MNKAFEDTAIQLQDLVNNEGCSKLDNEGFYLQFPDLEDE